MNKKLEEVYNGMHSLQEDNMENSGVKIYCNTWGNYNEYGADVEKINGGWKDLDDAVEWWKQMEEAGEEPFINDVDDYEDLPFNIEEGDYLPDIAEQINDYLDLDEYERDIIACIMKVMSGDYTEAKDIYDRGDYTYYSATTEYDLAMEIIDDFGGIKEALGDRASSYIDEDELRDAIYYDEYNYFEEEHREEYTDENGELDEDAFEEAFAEYFENMISDILDDPDTFLGDNATNFFDYEAYGRDLSYDYDINQYGSIMVY